MRDNSVGVRLLGRLPFWLLGWLPGWLPGFLLALPLAAVWVIGALMIAEPDGPSA